METLYPLAITVEQRDILYQNWDVICKLSKISKDSKIAQRSDGVWFLLIKF